jgi:hypothetical protein
MRRDIITKSRPRSAEGRHAYQVTACRIQFHIYYLVGVAAVFKSITPDEGSRPVEISKDSAIVVQTGYEEVSICMRKNMKPAARNITHRISIRHAVDPLHES